jgi:hypothetical protein
MGPARDVGHAPSTHLTAAKIYLEVFGTLFGPS